MARNEAVTDSTPGCFWYGGPQLQNPLAPLPVQASAKKAMIMLVINNNNPESRLSQDFLSKKTLLCGPGGLTDRTLVPVPHFVLIQNCQGGSELRTRFKHTA